MQGPTAQRLTVATTAQLTDEIYYLRLWRAVREAGIARREWLDAIADVLRDYEGELVHFGGKPYPVPLVDDAFGNDPEMRWLGTYLCADVTGHRPRRMSRMIQRLRLLDLYFRIHHPEIAQGFKRLDT